MAEPTAPAIDPAQLELALQKLRAEQNLPLGLVAGLAASLVGAGLWAAISLATNYRIGWMAIGVGFLVGVAVRAAGKGVDPVFAYGGAALSLLGCAAGNLLTGTAIVAGREQVSFLEELAKLDVQSAIALFRATFRPMDVLFYGLAGMQGYKLSLRQVTLDELRKLVPLH
jgi:hypothetical protein